MMSWEYFAGFFDGEGTIFVKRRMSPIVILGQSGPRGKALLSEIIEFLRASGITPSSEVPTPNSRTKRGACSKQGKRYKDFWQFQVANRPDALELLRRLLPYLRIKKVEAEDALRFCKLYGPLNSTGVYGQFRMRAICKQGHLLTPDNVYVQPGNKWRICRTCMRAKGVRQRQARRVA